VVTKGQLLSSDGALSPQIDVLALKPTYPPALHHKKKYLIAGVAAAFECKLTLKKHHIIETVETASIIKRMTHPSGGTPYRELTSNPIFGAGAFWKLEGIEQCSSNGRKNRRHLKQRGCDTCETSKGDA
jgi:hypothetical protein